MFDKNNITILCKVIDNYGDIGVVYRLAKSLSEKNKKLKITIICSDLESFSKLNSKILPDKRIQFFSYKNVNWTILDWTQTQESLNKLKDSDDFTFPVILECFQCGRPDWLENILFDEQKQTFHQIINIEYLTAEDWADDFHLLKSYTRNSFVKKNFFMPGFTQKTGGLIIDENFKNLMDCNNSQNKENTKNQKSTFKVSIFSYERSFIQIFEALNDFQIRMQKKLPDFCVEVLAAAGKSFDFAKSAWINTGRKVKFIPLDFLPQEEYDKVFFECDVNFVRGEESLVRSCLSSKPFLWHAYIQEEEYQLVKVEALLPKLLPFFSEEEKKLLTKLFIDYNTKEKELNKNELIDFFEQSFSLKQNFAAFTKKLLLNGELAENLLNYIKTLDYI